jgi:hypothetical protein
MISRPGPLSLDSSSRLNHRAFASVINLVPLESTIRWVSLALFFYEIKQGVYDIWQPAPIPEWQSTGDPRAKIRIGDMMHMLSGLRIRAPQDPDYDPAGPYRDHLYLYTGSVNSFHYAATRPLQWPLNTVGRYRNSDPVLINYLIRLAVHALACPINLKAVDDALHNCCSRRGNSSATQSQISHSISGWAGGPYAGQVSSSAMGPGTRGLGVGGWADAQITKLKQIARVPTRLCCRHVSHTLSCARVVRAQEWNKITFLLVFCVTLRCGRA